MLHGCSRGVGKQNPHPRGTRVAKKNRNPRAARPLPALRLPSARLLEAGKASGGGRKAAGEARSTLRPSAICGGATENDGVT